MERAATLVALARLSTRDLVLSHLDAVDEVLKFLGKTKAERSMRRRADPTPHVHERRRRGGGAQSVTHPMPFARGGADDGHVCSDVSSMSGDGRARALRALERLCRLTANVHDVATATRVRDVGGAVVLTAMLANEMGAIQELAACALANVLCAPPAGHPPPGATRDELIDAEEHEATASRTRDEVEGANAKKALVGLLSSPAARVNLVGMSARGETSIVTTRGRSASSCCPANASRGRARPMRRGEVICAA